MRTGVRWAALLVVALAGCASMSEIPNEPPVDGLRLSEPKHVALSPFRIKTGQGSRTLVSSYFSKRQPMQGWQPGQEYPIATQIITDELRSLGFRVVESTEGLLAPRIREQLEFLLSGTIEPLMLDIHDTYSGNYTEGHYRLSLRVVDALTGEAVWEGESDGRASLENDPEVIYDLAMGSNIVASLYQNEARVSRLIVMNALRSMIQAHADELKRIFTTRTQQR